MPGPGLRRQPTKPAAGGLGGFPPAQKRAPPSPSLALRPPYLSRSLALSHSSQPELGTNRIVRFVTKQAPAPQALKFGGGCSRRRGGACTALDCELITSHLGLQAAPNVAISNVRAGAERHPVGWVPALPAGFLSNVKLRDVEEAHRATLWPIWGPESHPVSA